MSFVIVPIVVISLGVLVMAVVLIRSFQIAPPRWLWRMFMECEREGCTNRHTTTFGVRMRVCQPCSDELEAKLAEKMERREIEEEKRRLRIKAQAAEEFDRELHNGSPYRDT